MQQSKSRHNFFSKQDHDKIFIETNYVPPSKKKEGKSPDLQYNVRKMLATSDLTVKLATKSPVITASSLQKYDDEPIPFDDQNDGASSVTSNHSEKLIAFKDALSKKVSHKLNLSLTPEQLTTHEDGLLIVDDDDDIDHIFDRHFDIHNENDIGDEEVELDDDDQIGNFRSDQRSQFSSTLEVHRSLMKEKESADTLRAIQLVESLKILAPPSDVNLAEFGSRKLAVVDSPSDKKKLDDRMSVTSSQEAQSPIKKSFMFLAKLASARHDTLSPITESARPGIKGIVTPKKPTLPTLNRAVVNYMSELITGDEMSVASSTDKVDYHLPLYEATPLKNVHEAENKPFLKLVDKAFAALTFQRKEPVVAPEARGIPTLKLKSLFDQNELVSAHLTRSEAKDDEQFYKALRDHVEKKKIQAKSKAAAEKQHKAITPAATASDVVSNISQYLENKKPPLPLKSALKTSKYSDEPSSTQPNIYKTAPTPMLDLNRVRIGIMSPVDSGPPSATGAESPLKLPEITSPTQSLAVRKQLFPQHSTDISSGPYSQALSPQVQRYVSDIHGDNDPHLRAGVALEDDEASDEDDDLHDLRVVRREAHSNNNSPETDKYKYQHSTTSFVLKNEVNNSQYGLYSRHAPNPDGWSGNGGGTIEFSERHLKAIEDSTTGNTAAVIYIPSTNKHSTDVKGFSTRPANESVLFSPNSSLHSITSQAKTSMMGSVAAQVELHAGTTLHADSYSGVNKQLNYTNSNYSLHSSSVPYLKPTHFGASSSVASSNSPRGLNNNKKAARFAVQIEQPSDLKNEINNYIQRITSPGTSVIGDVEGSDDEATARSAASAKEARDHLWYKLHHRYAGDKEGKHVIKVKVGDYILDGIKEDNCILNEYDKEMDEGWNV